jgi:hypothetical protein
MRIVSSQSIIDGMHRGFESSSFFYKSNKNFLKIAATGLTVITALGIITYYNVPVSLPLESEVDVVLHAFEKGRGLETFSEVDKDATIDRQDLVQKLLLIVRPKISKSYAVIVGENGTGKSTAVRKSLSALEQPIGAVYFNCPMAADQFSIALSRLIAFREQVDIKGGMIRLLEFTTKEKKVPDPKDEPLATFNTLIQPLMDAAAKFKSKHTRPMVLIIDSADILAKQNPAFLNILQDFAKLCADIGDLRIVFISGDGSALSLLKARGSWSRADNPPFEIGEIPDDVAVEYLKKKGVRDDQAKLAVANLTGGLFVSLLGYASASAKGMTYEQLAERLDRALDSKLSDMETSVNNALFRHLVKHRSIGTNEARRVIGMKKDQLDLLLKNNILAVHPNVTYTFHDRHTATWFSREVKKCDEAIAEQQRENEKKIAAWWRPGW